MMLPKIYEVMVFNGEVDAAEIDYFLTTSDITLAYLKDNEPWHAYRTLRYGFSSEVDALHFVLRFGGKVDVYYEYIAVSD